MASTTETGFIITIPSGSAYQREFISTSETPTGFTSATITGVSSGSKSDYSITGGFDSSVSKIWIEVENGVGPYDQSYDVTFSVTYTYSSSPSHTYTADMEIVSTGDTVIKRAGDTIEPSEIFSSANYNGYTDGTQTYSKSLSASDITWSPTSTTITKSTTALAFTGSYQYDNYPQKSDTITKTTASGNLIVCYMDLTTTTIKDIAYNGTPSFNFEQSTNEISYVNKDGTSVVIGSITPREKYSSVKLYKGSSEVTKITSSGSYKLVAIPSDSAYSQLEYYIAIYPIPSLIEATINLKPTDTIVSMLTKLKELNKILPNDEAYKVSSGNIIYQYMGAEQQMSYTANLTDTIQTLIDKLPTNAELKAYSMSVCYNHTTDVISNVARISINVIIYESQLTITLNSNAITKYEGETVNISEVFSTALYQRWMKSVEEPSSTLTVDQIEWEEETIPASSTISFTGSYTDGIYPEAENTATRDITFYGITLTSSYFNDMEYDGDVDLQYNSSTGAITYKKSSSRTQLGTVTNANVCSGVKLYYNNVEQTTFKYAGLYTIKTIPNSGYKEIVKEVYIYPKPVVYTEKTQSISIPINGSYNDILSSLLVYPSNDNYTNVGYIRYTTSSGTSGYLPETNIDASYDGCTCQIVVKSTSNKGLESETANFILHVGSIGSKYVDVDMTDYIAEKGVYDTYKTGRGTTDKASNLKRNVAFYNRGQANFYGWDNKEKSWFLGANKTVLQNWIDIIADKLRLSTTAIEDLSNWRFKIEYTSIGNQTYNLSRGTNYKSKRNAMLRFDNQNNSGTDIDKFITFNQRKLKRLGNKGLCMSQVHVTDWDDLADIFQTYNDYVIFSREMTIYHRNIDTDYYATTNYILQNYYTSMNSAKRNFENIDQKNAVKRNELRKVYYELSFTQASNQRDFKRLVCDNTTLSSMLGNNVNNEYMINVYALSPFFDNKSYLGIYGDDSRNIKIATDSDNPVISTNYNGWINIGGNMQCVNNIVNYTFQLEDNVFAGYQALWHTKVSGTGSEYPYNAFYNEGVSYAPYKNTFTNLYVMLGGHKRLDELILTNSSVEENINSLAQQLPINMETGMQNTEGARQVYKIKMYKDNAEKLGLSMNFEWVSDNDNIEILNPAENSLYQNNINSIKILRSKTKYYYNEQPYTTGDLKLKIGSDNSALSVQGLFYYNSKYYVDASHTKEVNIVNCNGDSNDEWVIVKDLSDNKLYLDKLDIELIDSLYKLQSTPLERIELNFNDNFYTYKTNTQVLVEYSSISGNTITTFERNGVPTTTSYTIKNITNGSGTVDITDGKLEITPYDTSLPITINDSIKISNYASKVSGGKLSVWIKIKDYFNTLS